MLVFFDCCRWNRNAIYKLNSWAEHITTGWRWLTFWLFLRFIKGKCKGYDGSNNKNDQRYILHCLKNKLDEGFGRFWRNDIRSKCLSPMINVGSVSTQAPILWCIQFLHNALNAAKVRNTRHPLMSTVLHELTQLFQGDAIFRWATIDRCHFSLDVRDFF